MQRLFFGPLQPREVERLYDQTWIFVTESLLAFTIFRDDFDIPFVLMFGFLLFVKCFHWLMADRVETMDQTTYPGPPLIFHIRMNLLFTLLTSIDFVMFVLAVESTLNYGVGGMVLFASEYAILLASAMNSIARYILSVVDLRRARSRGGENAPPMENKSMYVFYIELITDFLKLVTYLTFFMLILTFYGLPLNIVRDVYLTARSFITRLRALIRYHNATRDMDRRYPNATEAELAQMSDRTCIICREEMVSRIPAPNGAEAPAAPPQDGPNMTPKKLPCGHIFHFQCLRSWLERQQSCPTCRRPVLETTPNPRNQPQAQGRQGGVGPGIAPQPGQQPGGGAGGWLGRVFGAQQQQPLQGQFVHGQFVPAGAPQQPQQPQPQVGWVAPAPVWFPVYAQPPPPQHLQQPPPFRGFYGPGGVWQPWGMDPQWFGNAQQQQPALAPAGLQQPAPANAGHQQSPQQQGGSGAASTTASGTSGRSQDARQPPVSASTTMPATSEHVPAARNAAALAALRRRGQPAPTPTSSSVVRDASTSDRTGQTGAPGDPVATPSPTTTSVQGSPSPSEGEGGRSSSSQPGANDVTRPQIPSLIPLCDMAHAGPSMRPPAYVQPYPSFQAHYTPYFRNPAQQTRPPQGSSQQQPGSSRVASQSGQSQPSAPRYPRTAASASATRTQLAQLPPTLTDEQLARLDRLTRDAIDERLRVLEGVSGAVHRCIEELTRLRSVLPASATLGSMQGQGQERVAPGAAAATPSLPVAGPSASQGNEPTSMTALSAADPALTAGSLASALVSGSGESADRGDALAGAEITSRSIVQSEQEVSEGTVEQ